MQIAMERVASARGLRLSDVDNDPPRVVMGAVISLVFVTDDLMLSFDCDVAA